MNFVGLCTCIVAILCLFWYSSVGALPNMHTAYDLVGPKADGLYFNNLNVHFHSALFRPIDLLEDPVKLHLNSHQEFITPFVEFSPSDHPEKITCCPPYSQMALQAGIRGVLQASQEDLTNHLQFALDRLFRHLIFSFIVKRHHHWKEEVPTRGFPQAPSHARLGKNYSSFTDPKLAAITGDRCEDLLLLAPDSTSANSFSFIASDPDHVKGVERVIHNVGQDLQITSKLAVHALTELRRSLWKHYKEARSSEDRTDEAIYLAELHKILLQLTSTGRIHATEGSKLYSPADALLDNRCFLWLPRDFESWSFVNSERNQTGIYSFSIDQSSFFAGIQSEVIQAFDYGDQIEMLDVLPLGNADSSDKAIVPWETFSAEVFCDYLKLPQSIDDFQRIANDCWDVIQKYARLSGGISCEDKVHQSSNGLSGNFCYSGPPGAQLRILLSKKERKFIDEGTEKVNEEMRAQYVSDLNSPTLELMGFEFQNVSSDMDKILGGDDRSLEQPSLNILRRQGACNMAISEELRQELVEIWRSGIGKWKTPDTTEPLIDSLDKVTNRRDFLKRLAGLELVCPCKVPDKSEKGEHKSRFFP